jgi:hypothetical protein
MTGRGVRVIALFGVIGGILRAVGSFAPTAITSEVARLWLYIAIDACLAAGLTSMYLARRQRMSTAGRCAVVLALLGLGVLRIGSAVNHDDLYPIAAGAISVGVIVLATSEWAARRLPAWIPTAFVTSFACGALGLFLPRLDALFIASGMLFGVTFSAMALFMCD